MGDRTCHNLQKEDEQFAEKGKSRKTEIHNKRREISDFEIFQ